MKMKYRLFAMGAALIASTGIGTAIALGPAQAATVGPGMGFQAAAQTGPYHICLLNAPSLCLRSNGGGNQVTISSNDYADFTVVRTSGAEIQWENAAGNCLRAGDNNVVKLENGPCDPNGPNDWWVPDPNNPHILFSVGRGERMLTHGAVSGFNVWWGPFQSGDWDQWTPVS